MAFTMICSRCYIRAEPEKKIPGLFAVEGFLWAIALLIFGLVYWAAGVVFGIAALSYSLWRLTNKKEFCRSCGSGELVDPNSPRGRQIAGSLSAISQR